MNKIKTLTSDANKIDDFLDIFGDEALTKKSEDAVTLLDSLKEEQSRFRQLDLVVMTVAEMVLPDERVRIHHDVLRALAEWRDIEKLMTDRRVKIGNLRAKSQQAESAAYTSSQAVMVLVEDFGVAISVSNFSTATLSELIAISEQFLRLSGQYLDIKHESKNLIEVLNDKIKIAQINIKTLEDLKEVPE